MQRYVFVTFIERTNVNRLSQSRAKEKYFDNPGEFGSGSEWDRTVTEISPRGTGLNCSRNPQRLLVEHFIPLPSFLPSFLFSFFLSWKIERERRTFLARFSAGLTIVIRPPVSGIEIGKDRIVLSDREEEAAERLASLSPLCVSTWCPGYIASWYEYFRLSIPLGFRECFFVSPRLKHGRARRIDLKRFDRLGVLIRELITSTYR